jgi:phage terminase small subunit
MRTPTEKQLRFINAYDGSVKDAAEKAGLSYDYCRKIVTKPHIVCHLRDRSDTENNKLIATRQERQEFWSKIVRDSGEDMRHRLKASELLGRSEADFVERIEESGPGGAPIENKWIVEIVSPDKEE